MIARPAPEFSLAQARHLVRDLFEPSPAIYWADLLLSAGIGHAGLFLFYPLWRIVPGAEEGSPAAWTVVWMLRAAIFTIVCILYYRAANFIHELTHVRTERFTFFRGVWNLLAGIPFLMPSFMYRTHLEHHRRKHYGTEHDGEYLPFGSTPPWNIVAFMLTPFVVPVLAVVRFLVLAPLSWFVPPLREWVLARASSMIIDPSYVREVDAEEDRAIFWQELPCFLWLAGTVVAFCFLPEFVGFRASVGYALGVTIFFVNSLRTLGAHAWQNEGGEMTFTEQLLDSYNYPTGWAAELWGPIGLRYHALHHLFPSLPYHNLPEAHRRLMEGLPEDSPYRAVNRDSLTGVLVELWQRSTASFNPEPTAKETRVLV